MQNNTNAFLLSMFKRPVWAPADEGGGADGAGNVNTGGDTSGEGGSDTGQTTETVLGGDQADDKSGDDTALGGDASADSKNGDDAKDGDDSQTDEEKAAAEKAAEVPDDGVYEFELPDGAELGDDQKEFWSKEFKELGLTRGQAQKLVELQAQRVVQDQTDFVKTIEAQQIEHLTAAKADPEIGGDKWDASVKAASRGLDALRGGPKGDPEAKNPDGTPKGFKSPGALESLILSTGNGNNPEMVRELARIGALYAQDTFEGGDQSTNTSTSVEKSWYGDTTPASKKG